MIHIRVDDSALNADRRFGCGIGPELPEGDKWLYPGLLADLQADCPGCNPNRRELGTPISEVDGRNGGNAEWRRRSDSWGYP
jgi:hypothetical protein